MRHPEKGETQQPQRNSLFPIKERYGVIFADDPQDKRDPTGRQYGSRISELLKGLVFKELVFQGLVERVIADNNRGYYKDFDLNILGGLAGNRFLAVQFRKGGMLDGKGNSIPTLSGPSYQPQWQVDSNDNLAEYPGFRRPGKKSFKSDLELHFHDNPGFYNAPGIFNYFSKINADYEFVLNVYDRSVYQGISKSYFSGNPDSAPEPIGKVHWSFKGSATLYPNGTVGLADTSNSTYWEVYR